MASRRGEDVPKVIITFPAYRAETTLARTVADIPTGVAHKMILVDDASPDGTVQLARDLGIEVFTHAENRGYGGNQKTCYTQALRQDADIVVLLHPDYQYDPKAVPLLIAPILAGDADMTFGSRFAGLGNPLAGGMPAYRYWGNRLTTTLENVMLGSRFTDMHSGMRAYTRRFLLSLPFLRYSDDFSFDSQMLVDAVTSGQRVVEVPIPTRYTKESSSISIGRSIDYVGASLAYCARKTLARGRRGQRSPVTGHGRRPGTMTTAGRAVERDCILCGHRAHELIYPANATSKVAVEEFACTTPDLALHDDIVRCTRCGLVSSLPTLDAEEITGNYARVVDEIYLEEEAGRRELFGHIAESLGGYAVPGNRLLEAGSNVGLFLSVAGERGWQARGIEPSAWAVEQGRARFGVDLRQGTIEGLDEPPDGADAIVMLDVLEHLNDPLSCLKRLREIIADEGILVLSTVNLAGLHARARRGNWPWFIRSHLFYFSPRTLAAMLRRAGFRMVEYSLVPRSFHLSYIAERASRSHGSLAAAAAAVARIADPNIPMGWLGDITFVAARPDVPA